MTAITSEERSAFFGSFARDLAGNEHLLGLTAGETLTYLLFRRKVNEEKLPPSGSRSTSPCMRSIVVHANCDA
jgi:hypothetical protein